MNEMRKLMEMVEDNEINASATVNRFILRHKSGAYVSIFSFGDNSNIGNAKLFLSLDAVKYHARELSDGWAIVSVKVTIEELVTDPAQDKSPATFTTDDGREEPVRGKMSNDNVGGLIDQGR